MKTTITSSRKRVSWIVYALSLLWTLTGSLAYAVDTAPPVITYTALSNTSSTAAIQLNASITDETGVSSAVVYYKKNTGGTYTYTTGTLTSGSVTSGTWAFNIDPSAVGSVSIGDTIYYFVAAQDALNYLGSSPTGATGSTTSLTTYPTTPNRYRIVNAIWGNFMVGASQTAPNYTTLTAALNDLANRDVTADVTLMLQADYNPASEPAFPIVFQPFASTGSYTVTVKPDVGVSARISGSSTSAILRFVNNAHHYIIDGSNNGTNTRDLFITNTSTSTSSVVRFEGTVAGGGVKNSVLKNTVIKGGSKTSTIGVLVGGATVGLSSGGLGYDQLAIRNNYVYNCNTGIAVSGTGATTQVQNIYIENNNIGTDSASFYNRQYGVYLTYANAIRVTGNKIYNQKTTESVTIAGVYLSTSVTNSAIVSNKINGIYSESSSGYGAYGINIESSGNSNDSIINNEITDLLTSNYSSSSTIYNTFGIRVNSSASGLKLYYNTIHLSGQLNTGTSASTSCALYLSSTSMSGLDIRNNIFSNSLTGKTSGSKHYAFRWSGAITGATFDYNLFWANSTQGILMNNSGTDVTTLAALKTATSANASSISTDPMFNSNKIVVPKPGSPVLAAGTAISGLGVDITGAVRSATPAIGAYETGADLSGPDISYTKLINQTSLTNFTTSSFAAITDLTGVNTSMGTAPRLYFRKSSEANAFGANNNTFNGWKWVESTTGSSPFDFTIDYTLLSAPLAMGDTIRYFLVAQDLPGNLSAAPAAGFSGTSVAAITSAPTTPESYVIVNTPMSGPYQVGATGASYTTIGAAMNDLALRGVSGPVTIELIDASYTGETLPIVVSEIAGASAANSITIRPASGVSPRIAGGSAQAVFRIRDRVQYFTIDGSNNGTNSRNLTINNTSTATSAVIWFEGTVAGGGVKNSVLKNTVIKGGSKTSTIGVLVGGATVGLSSGGLGYDQLAVRNNYVYNCNTGIAVSGTGATTQVQNIYIENNNIGTDSTSFYNRQYGVYLTYANAIRVTGNKIYNQKTSESVTVSGVYLNTGVTNSAIVSNKISGIYSEATGGYGAYGINIESSGNDNDSIINNEITDLLTSNYSASSTTYNTFGIRVSSSASNLKIYYNSVHLSGQLNTGTSASTSWALYLGSASMSGIDIRNNIFSNSLTGKTTGSKHYAFRWSGAITGATFDYNLFWANSAQGILMSNNGTDVTTLAALKTATSANANSLSVDPMFNSNYIVVPRVGAPVLNAGTAIPGIGTDISGTLRNAITPAIGAYETGADVSGPDLSYTRIGNQTSLTNFTTSSFATITDPSGVSTTPGTAPRLYFKKSGEANAFGANNSSFNGWKWVESYTGASPFDFTIDYSLLNTPIANGDTIRYFLAAQDVSGYVNAIPFAGFAGTSVSAITAAPATPDYYIIVGGPMSGNYTVGTGGTYANLSAAATDISLRGLQSDVTLEIISNITEPAAVTIPQWTETGAGNYRLQIVPSATNPAGDTVFATVASNGMIVLWGADRVTIDGRINGTGNFLTFMNKSTGTTQYGIRVMSAGTMGAVDNTIRNVNVLLGYNGTGNQTHAIRVDSNSNHNLRILNNNIAKCAIGIVVSSSTTSGAGNHQNMVISGNTIGSATTANNVTVAGIVVSYAPAVEISGNHIFNIIGSHYVGSSGVQINAQTTAAKITRNLIHDVINSYYYYDWYYGYEEAGPAKGIDLSSNTVDSVLIANNVIYRLSNASYSPTSTTENPFGIAINGGRAHQVLHNSVYLYGTQMTGATTGGTLSAALVINGTATNIGVENNILANGFTGRAGSKSYAIYIAAAGTSFSTINRNNYDTTGAGSFARIGYKGSDALTIAAWKALSTQDAQSIATTSGFISNTNLNIGSGATPSGLESGASVLTNVTTDYNGDPRPKIIPTTYGGNTAPDIGAYEFDGTPGDVVPPVITYTPIPKISSNATSETLQATITDAGTGVSSVLAPRIYYKKKNDANVYAGNTSSDNGWKYTIGTAGAPYSFTLDYSLLTGGSVTNLDTILYFVTAQDLAMTPNTSANPGNGFKATTVDAITIFPSNPNYYIVSTQGPMSGPYTVGASVSNSYQTISAALTALAIRGVNGPVTFELTDAAYTTAETFPLIVEEIVGASSFNTVTIRPAPGVNTWIAGSSSQSIFRIRDNVKYFTIDGSNNGSTTRNMVINNTSTATSAVIWFEGTSAAGGVRNSVVKNALIKGGSQTGSIGILMGGATMSLTSSGTGHANNEIYNNNIYFCNAAVVLYGSASGKLSNISVHHNELGTDTTALYNRQYGVYMNKVNGARVEANKIFNQKSSGSVNLLGVVLDEGTTNSAVAGNTITGIYASSTTGYGAIGIGVASNTDVDNDSIYNNMISDLLTINYSGTSTTWNAFGIRISGGSNLKIYHNTVNLFGTLTIGTSVSASAALLINISDAGALAGLDIRNNIFSNSITGVDASSKHAAYWTTRTSNPTGLIFNYNNFYASGPQGILMNNGGTAVNTLAALKTATAANANSQSQSLSYTAPTNLRLIAPSNGDGLLAGTPVAAVATDIDNNLRSSVYPYMGAHEASTPLPVKLLSFDAKLSGNDVLLNWITASETNNKGFDLERSADNRTFEKVTFVKGKGNSAVKTAYRYTDAGVFAKHTNVMYYRLRQLDKDGRESLSQVVRVSSEELGNTAVSVYPNPFNREVSIDLPATGQNFSIEVRDLQGRIVAAKQVDANAGAHTVVLDLEHLGAGLYFVKLNGADDSKVVKIVKTGN